VEAAFVEHRLSSPRAHRAGHDRHGRKEVPGAPLEVLRGDILERLPARVPVHAVADLGVSGHRAHARVFERLDQPRHRVGHEERVAVERDHHLAARMGKAQVQRGRFAAVGLPEDADS
jgi:hypothetical protein